MSNGSIRAVLFDLDDTLYDEMSFVRSGFQCVADHLAKLVPSNPQELVSQMMDALLEAGRGKVFDKVLQSYHACSADLVERLIRLYRQHQPKIGLYPEVLPVLQELRRLGLRTGIITDGLHTVQKRKIAALHLGEWMDVIICTDERGREYWKPNPAAFEQALAVVAVKPNEAVYVGNDPAKDFAGPNSIGMLSVHLCRSGISMERSCGAVAHVTELAEVIRIARGVSSCIA
jgi:putative hydrolase of the HAD superfamily